MDVPGDVSRNEASETSELTVESVDLGDLPGLVVSPEQRDPVRPPGLERQEARKCLEAVIAAVDKVPEKDVVGVGDLSARPKKLLEVVKLSVDVAADGDGGGHGLNVGLLEEEIAHDITEFLKRSDILVHNTRRRNNLRVVILMPYTKQGVVNLR
jgi:hypothetical protein